MPLIIVPTPRHLFSHCHLASHRSSVTSLSERPPVFHRCVTRRCFPSTHLCRLPIIRSITPTPTAFPPVEHQARERTKQFAKDRSATRVEISVVLKLLVLEFCLAFTKVQLPKSVLTLLYIRDFNSIIWLT